MLSQHIQIDLNELLPIYLWYSYYSIQQNYGGQKKKALSLWELLMFWNTFDSVSDKSTRYFLRILSTTKNFKIKNADVSQQSTEATGSQNISFLNENINQKLLR